MLNLHFPFVTAFLEKTDTQLAHSGYFIQTITRLIGKGPNYQSHLALAAHVSRQPTQISVPFDCAIIKRKNSRSARSVLGLRSAQLQALMYTKGRLSRETTLQGLNRLKTISQPL